MKPKSMWSCWWQWKSVGPLACNQIDIDDAVPRQPYGVLHDAGHGNFGDALELEAVAVNVNGMGAAGRVDEAEAVSPALFYLKRQHVGEGLTVDGPGADLSGWRSFLLEEHGDGLHGFGFGWSWSCEQAVVPVNAFGRLPLGLACFSGVFDDEPKTFFALGLVGGTENPLAGLGHFDDCVDALGDGEREDLDRSRMRHGVAVESNHCEFVVREGEQNILSRAGVEEMK